MRTRDAFLILRFLTWPPAILGIAIFTAFAFLLDCSGLNKPSKPQDLVCLGAKEYDVNNREEINELISDFGMWQVDPYQVILRPPCDNAGSRITASTMNKIYGPPVEEKAAVKK
jgi:hypothetical protein